VGQSDHVKWGTWSRASARWTFHGNNGAGLGASHQTGWTGVVARLIQGSGDLDAAAALEDPHWPLARPYRRLAAESVADVTTARKARGVSEPKSP
jgi:hypothetical protein